MFRMILKLVLALTIASQASVAIAQQKMSPAAAARAGGLASSDRGATPGTDRTGSGNAAGSGSRANGRSAVSGARRDRNAGRA